MARPSHVYTIDYVAKLIGENIELIRKVVSVRGPDFVERAS
jgi:hypothetical protein